MTKKVILSESAKQPKPKQPESKHTKPEQASLADYDYLFKFRVVGDSGVGKSCLLRRFADGVYTDNYISTIGIDFIIKILNLNGKTVKLQVWDTFGQGKYRTVQSAYYRGVHAEIAVFDLTNKVSFNNIKAWIENDCDKYKKVILIGSKVDLTEKRVVNPDEIEAFMESSSNVEAYIETSAKTGENVEAAFQTATQVLMDVFFASSNETINQNNNNQPTPKTVKSNQGWWCCLFPFLNKRENSDDTELKQSLISNCNQ